MWEIWPSAPERTGWWPGMGCGEMGQFFSHFSQSMAVWVLHVSIYLYIYILLDIYILCGEVRIRASFEGLGMIDYDMPSWDV